MLRLILLFAAGGYVYSLGQHNAATPAGPAPATVTEAPPAVVEPPSKPSAFAAVAKAGVGWVARTVHEQTAWAADKDPAADAMAIAQGAVAREAGLRGYVQPQPEPVYEPVAAAFAPPPEPPPVAVAAQGARRGLKVVYVGS